MARKSVLRAVGEDEVPLPPMTLAEAIESGNYLWILLAQRREIVRDLPEEKGPAKAAMHRQLSLLSKEIEALETRAQQEDDPVAQVEDGKFDASAI